MKDFVFNMQYVLCKTEFSSEEELNQHDQNSGKHFNLPGHKISDMTICVIEKLRKEDPTYRKVRESMHIQNFGATKSLLNKKR